MSVNGYLDSIFTGSLLELAFFQKDANLKLGCQFATSVMYGCDNYSEKEFNKSILKYNKRHSSCLDCSLDEVLKAKVLNYTIENNVILIQIDMAVVI